MCSLLPLDKSEELFSLSQKLFQPYFFGEALFLISELLCHGIASLIIRPHAMKVSNNTCLYSAFLKSERERETLALSARNSSHSQKGKRCKQFLLGLRKFL